MNKGELVDHIAEELEVPKALADRFINSFTDAVYTSYTLNHIWAGTPDGLFYSSDNGVTWIFYRSWNHMSDSSNDEKRLSTYPNPFYIDEHNQYQGDGHVRIAYYDAENNNTSWIDTSNKYNIETISELIRNKKYYIYTFCYR